MYSIVEEADLLSHTRLDLADYVPVVDVRVRVQDQDKQFFLPQVVQTDCFHPANDMRLVREKASPRLPLRLRS